MSASVEKATAKPKKQIKLPEDTKTGGAGGGRTMVERKSQAEIQAEIKDLLKDLADSTDTEEKKRIRRALRIRGHRGGLGEKRLITAKPGQPSDTKASSAPKGKRAAKSKGEVDAE